MSTDFRYLAKQALSRAKAELATLQNERIKYAALELRLAMEAVTYDRVLAVKNEIPPEEYKKWQPRKLMQVLHDIDPALGISASIAAGVEETYGIEPPPDKMQFLGTDKVFTLADLKEHYDAIGSYLHVPSLDQFMKSAMLDETKARSRCNAVVETMDAVLNSPIWNATFGIFAEFECVRCKTLVRKRMPHGKDKVDATCFQCRAQYVVSSKDVDQVLVKPKTATLKCETVGCAEVQVLWPDEVKPGKHWVCKGCGEHWMLDFGILRADTAR